MTIKHIALHHSGGTHKDNFASSSHLSFGDINQFHKNRPDFIGYKAHKSSMGYYVGYNAVYDPKTREFRQARKIGEETLAQSGFNQTAFSLCIIGNYNRLPLTKPSKPVDEFHPFMTQDICSFLEDLIDGNKRGLLLAPDTVMDFSVFRIKPHRTFAPVGHTDCYGIFLPDNYFTVQRLIKKYKSMSLSQFMAWFRNQSPAVGLGAVDEPSCSGYYK